MWSSNIIFLLLDTWINEFTNQIVFSLNYKKSSTVDNRCFIDIDKYNIT